MRSGGAYHGVGIGRRRGDVRGMSHPHPREGVGVITGLLCSEHKLTCVACAALFSAVPTYTINIYIYTIHATHYRLGIVSIKLG